MNRRLTATEHTPTRVSDGGSAAEAAGDGGHSVLFAYPFHRREPATEPSFFADLILDQMVATINADHGEPLPTSYAEDTYAQVFKETLH